MLDCLRFILFRIARSNVLYADLASAIQVAKGAGSVCSESAAFDHEDHVIPIRDHSVLPIPVVHRQCVQKPSRYSGHLQSTVRGFMVVEVCVLGQ